MRPPVLVRSPRTVRALSFAILGGLALCHSAASCVDPGSKFDEYLTETDSQRGFRSDGGTSEGVAVGADLAGVYHLSCLSNFLNRDPAVALRFKLDVTVSMNEDGTAKSTFTLTALKLGTSTLSDVTGAPFSAQQSLALNSRFSANFGTISIPADANPTASGNIIDGTHIEMKGGFLTRTSGCAELSGELTQPIQTSLAGDGDTCVLVKSTDGSAPPILDIATYNACPSF